jgi:transcriptional regulator with XRE-family HTH domain
MPPNDRRLPGTLHQVPLLEALRVDRGMTIKQVSDQTGIAPRTLRKYERATTRPRGAGLEILARLYNVRASDLLADIRQRYEEPEDAVAA